MLTLKDLITSSGKYPDRMKHKELTPEVLKNLNELLSLINPLLLEAEADHLFSSLPKPAPWKVSSGFRPSDVNSKIANAAKKSLHMVGKAVDIEDPEGLLSVFIKSKPELLDKYGLWLENPAFTKTWTHLDNGTRADRPVRIFNP